MEKKEVYSNILMFRFKDLQKAMYQKANKLFSKEDMPISLEQLPVLMTLFYKGALSQQEIADYVERDKSSVLRTVKSLGVKKLVELAQNPFDMRKKMVQLTKEGQNMAESINSKILIVDQVIFACLSEEEKATLEGLMLKCIEHARK